MRLRDLLAQDAESEIEPRSFVFPDQANDFKQYSAANREAVFIAKPKCSSEGCNVLLFRNLKDIPGTMGNDMIVQRYIPNPLTLDNLKFDLRIYVVITNLACP